MVNPIRLNNPPIKEALIDFQVHLPENTNINSLNPHLLEFSERYPKRESIVESRMDFNMNIGKPAEIGSQHKHIGFKYTSSDNNYIAQFRLTGLTISRLDPYNSWDNLKAEAQYLWSIYAQLVNPTTIFRTTARYINVMPLRLREIPEIDKWLVAAPSIPEGLPQGIASFLSRIVISHPDIEANGIITLALENAHSEKPPIMFDIDVFTNKIFDAREMEFWADLEKLREFKNEIFFRNITELTKREFQ